MPIQLPPNELWKALVAEHGQPLYYDDAGALHVRCMICGTGFPVDIESTTDAGFDMRTESAPEQRGNAVLHSASTTSTRFHATIEVFVDHACPGSTVTIPKE